MAQHQSARAPRASQCRRVHLARTCTRLPSYHHRFSCWRYVIYMSYMSVFLVKSDLEISSNMVLSTEVWGHPESRIPCSWPVPTCQRVEGLITAKALSCPPFWHSYLPLSMVLNHTIPYHIISYHNTLCHILYCGISDIVHVCIITICYIISFQVSYHTSCHKIVCCFVLNALHQYMNWLSSILLSMSWHLEANGGKWSCGPVSSGSRMAGRPNIDPQI